MEEKAEIKIITDSNSGIYGLSGLRFDGQNLPYVRIAHENQKISAWYPVAKKNKPDHVEKQEFEKRGISDWLDFSQFRPIMITMHRTKAKTSQSQLHVWLQWFKNSIEILMEQEKNTSIEKFESEYREVDKKSGFQRKK